MTTYTNSTLRATITVDDNSHVTIHVKSSCKDMVAASWWIIATIEDTIKMNHSELTVTPFVGNQYDQLGFYPVVGTNLLMWVLPTATKLACVLRSVGA